MLHDFHENLPDPGSGVVGGSGVVNLLLKDPSSSSVLFCSLRLDCFLRELWSVELFRVLLLFRFFGLSTFSVTLTVFLLSVSSSDDGSYDLLDTSRSSSSASLVFDFEMLRYFGLEEDTRLLVIGADVVLLLWLFVPNLRAFWIPWVRIFFRLSTDFVFSIVFLRNNNNSYFSNLIKKFRELN